MHGIAHGKYITFSQKCQIRDFSYFHIYFIAPLDKVHKVWYIIYRKA